VTRGTWLALGAMAISVFVIANDVTALSVALPQIEKDFDADVSTVQWVINAYALVFGVLIVTGGRLADMIGRRRVFFIGAAIFALFSVLGGAAQDELWLIACRALMGIGGAMMCYFHLGITVPSFTRQLYSVLTINSWTFWLGFIKAPVFAAIIVLVGCYEGLRVEGNAGSVGSQTTRSVVESIFLVIVFDASFSILFSLLGI